LQRSQPLADSGHGKEAMLREMEGKWGREKEERKEMRRSRLTFLKVPTNLLSVHQ